MAQKKKSERDHILDARVRLMDAILPHVAFDGWSAESFAMALADSGLDAGLAKQAAPRGALDLAVAFHKAGDAEMLSELAKHNLGELRYRDRVALAVKLRLQVIPDKEAVRRAVTLFTLPHHAVEGSKLVWNTVDLIWNTLGDTSDDVNWYTKRMTLSGVYSSCLLYWLGDTSENHARSWEFLDRRIENVMQFEKVKAKLAGSPIAKGIQALTRNIQKPDLSYQDGLPGKRF